MYVCVCVCVSFKYINKERRKKEVKKEWDFQRK